MNWMHASAWPLLWWFSGDDMLGCMSIVWQNVLNSSEIKLLPALDIILCRSPCSTNLMLHHFIGYSADRPSAFNYWKCDMVMCYANEMAILQSKNVHSYYFPWFSCYFICYYFLLLMCILGFHVCGALLYSLLYDFIHVQPVYQFFYQEPHPYAHFIVAKDAVAHSVDSFVGIIIGLLFISYPPVTVNWSWNVQYSHMFWLTSALLVGHPPIWYVFGCCMGLTSFVTSWISHIVILVGIVVTTYMVFMLTYRQIISSSFFDSQSAVYRSGPSL